MRYFLIILLFALPIKGQTKDFFLDITNQIQGDKIHFSLSDSSSPALITDEQQEGTIFVLMPMRV